jgi:hypothetical protein
MPLIRKTYPTKTRLWELFDYHPDGYLKRKSNGKLNGVSGNYAKITIDKQVYCVHKCIFIMHSKFDTFKQIVNAELKKNDSSDLHLISDYVIDHIDRDKFNNRIENLRLLTMEENWNNSKAKASWDQFLWVKNPDDRSHPFRKRQYE